MSFPLNDKTSTIDTRTLSVSNTMTQPRVPDVTLWPAAPAGSTVYDEATSEPYFYDGAAWQPFGGGGGGEDLAATLALGNTSGANNIVMSAGQGIDGATSLALTAQAGNATLTSATATVILTADVNASITANNGSVQTSASTSNTVLALAGTAELRSVGSTAQVRGNGDATVLSDTGDVVLSATAAGAAVTVDDHLVALGAAPTIAGGIADIDPLSTDIAGRVLNWDNDGVNDIQVTFAKPFPVGTKPMVVITPASATTADLATSIRVDDALSDNTQFTAACSTAGDPLTFYYQVIGTR